ncbi:MAG: type II secretion system protein M, partial [Deltaproteobacteria bacterium]|nr:type II secretion system protein M [Deltaproteobacteria bacterium]
MFDRLKEKLSALLEPVQTEINRLSARERMIVYGGLIGFVFFIAIVILIWVASTSSSYTSKIANSKENIQTIHELGKKYQKSEQQVSQLDAMISQAPKDFRLATELESIARQNEIQIDSLKERAGQPHEYYEETQVVVSIKDVDLRSLIDFFQSIESSRRFMLITNLSIKP